jgi:hypothetical protein
MRGPNHADHRDRNISARPYGGRAAKVVRRCRAFADPCPIGPAAEKLSVGRRLSLAGGAGRGGIMDDSMQGRRMVMSRVPRLITLRSAIGATSQPPAASAASRLTGLRSSAHLALRELQKPQLRAVIVAYGAELATLLGLGAVFGWMGPFGTYGSLGPLDRFMFWMAAMPLVGLPSSLAAHLCLRSQALEKWPWPARIGVSALIAAIPGVLIVRALTDLFRIHVGGAFATLAGSYASIAIAIAGVGTTITMVVLRVQPPRFPNAFPPPVVGSEPAAAAPRLPATSPFLARIPRRLGKNLRWIETEDHYLRVHTDLGNDLVLFRLADAVLEIDPGLGAQVHRSHWVARTAVAAVEREAGRITLRLTDGARVPVSRTFQPALRRAGWL